MSRELDEYGSILLLPGGLCGRRHQAVEPRVTVEAFLLWRTSVHGHPRCSGTLVRYEQGTEVIIVLGRSRRALGMAGQVRFAFQASSKTIGSIAQKAAMKGSGENRTTQPLPSYVGNHAQDHAARRIL